jgi:hypothetical protein
MNNVRKKLIKLTPVVTFTNVLRASFVRADLKRTKILSSHQYIFAL